MKTHTHRDVYILNIYRCINDVFNNKDVFLKLIHVFYYECLFRVAIMHITIVLILYLVTFMHVL